MSHEGFDELITREGSDGHRRHQSSLVSSLESPPLRGRWILAGLGCSFLVCATVLWLSGASHLDFLKALKGLRWTSFLGVIALSASVWFTRSVRLVCLFPRSSMRDALMICAAHNALTRLLPARAGELSLPMLLSKRNGVPISEGGLAMIWLRLIEVACLGLVIGGAALIWISPTIFSPLMMMTLGVVTTLAIIAALLMRPIVYLFLKRMSMRFTWARRAFEGASSSAQLSKRRVVMILGLTLAILLQQALLFALILWGVGSHLSYLSALLGSGAVHLSGVLPAPTIGNVGSHEAGWILIYTQLGVSAPIATLSALLSQWLTLGLALIWWAIMSWLRVLKR